MNSANAVYMRDGLLWIDVVGDQTGESVRTMGEQIYAQIEVLRSENLPVLILDNLTQIGNASMSALQGVAILGRLLDYDRAAMVDKQSALMRSGSNMLLTSIGRSNARYFSDLEVAKVWLRQGQVHS